MNVIGIDIGGTNIEVGLVDENGNILAKKKYKTRFFDTPDLFAEYIYKLIKNQWKSYRPQAIGVGAPTANYFSGNIEYAPNLPWQGVIPMEKLLNEATNLPVKITNDANAVAYAELKFGEGKKYKNFTVITLGTGLGSGIVVDGKILYGENGLAGEFGHVQVVPNGRPCTCGRKGCLETYVSIRGIEETYQELGGSSELNPYDIYQLAKQGEPTALYTYKQTAFYFGLKLADLIHIFAPKRIFLYGGIANSADILIPFTEEVLKENLMKPFQNLTKIEVSKLQSESKGGILGAAALAFEILNE